MAKHNVDPVLQHLVKAIDETPQAAVAVAVSARGMVLTGDLIAQDTYFSELVAANPLLTALQPTSGLLGKEYTSEVSTESGHHLHLRGTHDRAPDDRLWRISLESVDAWSLRNADADEHEAQGPFARLLNA